MNAKRMTAAVVGALVAGVVLGSVVSGYAATTTPAPTAKTVAGACGAAGLRLGVAMRDSGGRMLDVVAKLTGTTAADVQTKRAAGKTFAQIAAEKNVSSAAVVAEALKVRKTLLAEKVAAGAITQAQADTALGNMKTRLNDRVNTANADCDGSGAGGGMGGGQGRGRGAGGGMGGGRGAGCGANCTTPAQ
jgi:hypothetical protein